MSKHVATDVDTSTRRRRAGAVGTLAAAGALLTVLAGTTAVFTDQAVIADNTFESGTFDLTATQTSRTLNIEDFAPGESTTVDVKVTNSGSIEMRYAVVGGFEAKPTLIYPEGGGEIVNLGDVLDVTITKGGTELFHGKANAATTALVGDAQQGAQAGDRVLAPNAEENLQITVAYPADAAREYAGAGADLTLDITGEQTRNNP